MRTKNNAQLLLEQVEKQNTMIRNKLIERKQWMDIALSITSSVDSDRGQPNGNRSKMAEAVNKCVDMEAEIDRAVDKLIEAKKNVIGKIEELESTVEYNVLHMRYIQGKDLQDIADFYKRDYTWATTMHSRAVSSLDRMLADQRFVMACDEI